MTDKFWVVWNPNGESPMHRHDSEHLAKKEAERLARVVSDEEFYVLEAITVSRKSDVVTEVLHELPF